MHGPKTCSTSQGEQTHISPPKSSPADVGYYSSHVDEEENIDATRFFDF